MVETEKKKKKWDVAKAVGVIRKTGGSLSGKTIKHKSPGLATLAAIDYLVGQHKYFWSGTGTDTTINI